jgi:hypothetical protein
MSARGRPCRARRFRSRTVARTRTSCASLPSRPALPIRPPGRAATRCIMDSGQQLLLGSAYKDDGADCAKPSYGNGAGKPLACQSGYSQQASAGICCPNDVPYPVGKTCYKDESTANEMIENIAVPVGLLALTVIIGALTAGAGAAALAPEDVAATSEAVSEAAYLFAVSTEEAAAEVAVPAAAESSASCSGLVAQASAGAVFFLRAANGALQVYDAAYFVQYIPGAPVLPGT